MARVYYREKKLIGKPYISDKVTIETFNYIIKNIGGSVIYIEPKKKKTLGIFSKEIPCFRQVMGWEEVVCYDSPSNGKLYLPNALILSDENVALCPSEFYFLASINQQLELRLCRTNTDTKWSDIPDINQSVEDKRMFEKVENTIAEVLKQIAIKIETKRRKQASKPIESDTNKQSSPSVKQAYINLTNLLIEDTHIQNQIIALVNQTEDIDWYDFLEFVADQDLHIAWEFDWKAGVADFVWGINQLLKKSQFSAIQLPQENLPFDDEVNISQEGVFSHYDKLLRKEGLQLSFVDMESDSYVIIIHPIDIEEEIASSIEDIGYTHENVSTIQL